MPDGSTKFDLNRCNESYLRGEKRDFWPVSKNNTGSLPLRGNPAGKKTNTTFSHLQPARVVRSSPNFAWTSRPLKKVYVESIFDPTEFFLQGAWKKFGVNDLRAVSLQ